MEIPTCISVIYNIISGIDSYSLHQTALREEKDFPACCLNVRLMQDVGQQVFHLLIGLVIKGFPRQLLGFMLRGIPLQIPDRLTAAF